MRNKIQIFSLFVVGLILAGCATTVQYFPYTAEKFPPKPRDYFIPIYPLAQQRPVTSQPYVVIGKIDISGKVSNGVTPETLSNQAKMIARKRGADAIINAKTEHLHYNGIYTVPGQLEYRPIYWAGRRREGVLYMEDYHPPQYVPYSETVLTFQGELIVFNK